MVKTPSTMLPIGTLCPDFSLPDAVSGETVSPAQFEDAKGLLVVFMCNHCPFVKHIADELANIGKEYQPKGIAMVGISSNDVMTHPDDSPEKMKEEAQARGYTFPYLYDESQDAAKIFHAACTPDFFLFDKDRKLVYRGQLDDSRPESGIPVTGKDLRAALDAVVAEKEVPAEQKPSIGCNIKWRSGNEPEYFNPEGIP